MLMTALPSIVILFLVAIISFVGSAVLRKPWERRLAMGLAAMEMSMAIGLTIFSWN